MIGGKKGVLQIADNKDHLSSADSIINPSVNVSRVKHGNLHVSYNYSQDRQEVRPAGQTPVGFADKGC